MPMYSDDSIKRLEAKGFADASANATLGNEISLLSLHGRFEEAEALLSGITIPSIRRDLEHVIEFDRTCTCIRK